MKCGEVKVEGRRKSSLVSEEEKTDESFNRTSGIKDESAVYPNEYEEDIVKNLSINLPFPIPILHQNILPGTPSNKKSIIEGVTVKFGPFSKSEDATIMNNWKQFCNEHNLDVSPCTFFSFRGMKKEEKQKFLQYIAHGLDDRPPDKVHLRFKKIYENMFINKGRFSREEDMVILDFMENHGSTEYPFLNLSKILNRNSTAVLKRYEILKRSENNNLITWDLELSEKLINRMMKVGKCESVEDLRYLQFSTRQWRRISRKMGNIPLKKIQRGWKITVYPRLFSEPGILPVKRKIVQMLQQRKATDWRTINWAEIAENFKGYTPEKVYNLFRTLVNFHVPKSKQSDLGECIKVLNTNAIKRMKKFRRYKFEEGKLSYESGCEEGM